MAELVIFNSLKDKDKHKYIDKIFESSERRYDSNLIKIFMRYLYSNDNDKFNDMLYAYTIGIKHDEDNISNCYDIIEFCIKEFDIILDDMVKMCYVLLAASLNIYVFRLVRIYLNQNEYQYEYHNDIEFINLLILLRYDDSENNNNLCKDIMTKIINNIDVDCKMKFTWLSILSSDRMKSKYYPFTLKIPFRNSIATPLYLLYWNNTTLSIYYRLLCCYYLMQITNISTDKQNEIIKNVMEICYDENISVDMRGVAIDVILYCGTTEQKIQIEKLISTIGGGKNIYENSQNSHNKYITKKIDQYIEKIPNEKLNFDDIYQTELYEMLDNYMKRNIEDIEIYNTKLLTIAYIMTDNFKISNRSITNRNILYHVLDYIKHNKNKNMLLSVLITDLDNIDNVCISGIYKTLINILSLDTNNSFNVSISIEDQIKSYINQYIKLEIEKLDGDEGDDILMDMGSSCERIILKKFLENIKLGVKKYIVVEFVDQNLTTNDVVILCIDEVFDKYLSVD